MRRGAGVLPFAVLALTASVPASGQTVSFGALAGSNWMDLRTDPDPGFPIDAGSGWQVAGFIDVAKTTGPALQLRLTQWRGDVEFRAEPATATVRIDYTASAVLAKWQPIDRRVTVLGGMELAVRNRARVRPDLSESTVEVPFDHRFKRTNLGLAAGVDLRLARGFFLEGLYVHGVQNIRTRTEEGNLSWKSRSFRLSAGIGFWRS